MLEYSTNYITKRTFRKLSDKLEFLKNEKLPTILQEKHEAYEEGGVHENAGYETAVNDEAIIQAEIAQIEERLRNPVFIDDLDADTSQVSIGTLVELEDIEFGEINQFVIVGYNESEVTDGFIEFVSIYAPLAQAMLGKKTNTVFELNLPNGEKIIYKINRIAKYF